MTKSLFRALFAVTGAVLLAATALPAAGATLTYNDPNCAGFQITGSGGSFTLTCGKLSCSISGMTTPTTAVGTALTATCTPGSSGYLWSLVTGPFSDATCNAPSQPTSATTNIPKPTGIVAGQTKSCLYQVNGTAASLSGQAMATVTWSDASTAPPVCTPAAATVPTPMTSAGGSVSLGAGCVPPAPPAAVTYTWTRTAPTAGAPTNPTSAIATDTLAANTGASAVTYTWQVVACTSPTTCVTKSVSISVPAPGGPPPPPPPGGISCSGFTKTVNVDLGWPAAGTTTVHTQTYGGFNGGDVLAIRIAPPVGSISNSGTAGLLSLAEYGAPAATRYAVLTTTACDFTGESGYLDSFTIPIRYGGVSVSISPIQVNRKEAGTAINLLPGTVYYLLVKNTSADGITPSCSGYCDMVIQFTKPPGT